MCRPDGARVMWLLRIFYKGVAPLELVIYDLGFLINEVVFFYFNLHHPKAGILRLRSAVFGTS